MHFVASPVLSSLFACVYVCFCQRLHVCVDDFTRICICACAHGAFAASELSRKPTAFCCWCCFTLLFYTLDAISCYLETQLSIISIVAGKLQSAFDLLLIFFLLVTLKWVEKQWSRNYRMVCDCVLVCVCVCVRGTVTRNVFTSSKKVECDIF